MEEQQSRFALLTERAPGSHIYPIKLVKQATRVQPTGAAERGIIVPIDVVGRKAQNCNVLPPPYNNVRGELEGNRAIDPGPAARQAQ